MPLSILPAFTADKIPAIVKRVGFEKDYFGIKL
jgi:hypothetical protein